MCLDLNTSRSPFWSGPPRFRPQHVRALGVALVEKPSCGHPVRAKADQQSTHRTQSRKRVTQALSRVRHELRRQTPKVGAGCSNWARPDPCGGCPAMGIPTAILAPQLPFDCRLADGLRSVGSCHSFPPLVGRCQDGPGSPTRLLATKRGWLRAVSSNLWVRVFLSRGCLPPRVQLWPRRPSVRLSKSTPFARDGRPDRRKTLLGQIFAATLYLRFCQKQRNLMCRPTIRRRPVGRACFNPMQTPTLRRLAAHPGTPMAARH